MASVMAIVSKSVFEKLVKQAEPVDVGAVLGIDRYNSTHKSLTTLRDGGHLFLVTVRPPDERLWLVGVLDAPTLKADGWVAEPSRTPITDITGLKGQLRFVTGTGIQAKPGALAMSLQTPRGLTDADVDLLTRASNGGGANAKKATARAAKVARVEPPKRSAKVVVKVAPPKRSAENVAKAKVIGTGGGDANAKVEAALSSRDGAAALLAAIAWWRETHAPNVADLIDAISERVSAAAPADHNEWAKIAKNADPLDLGRLLPAVTTLPASFLPTAGQLLSQFPDDPRLSRAIATWASDPPTTSSSTYSFWTRVLDRLSALGDTRVIETLEARRRNKPGGSQFWPKFYAALDRSIGTLRAAPVTKASVPRELMKMTGALSEITALPARATKRSDDAPKLSGSPLEQAEQHLREGRVPAAIEALLVAWRGSRAIDLAEIIDRATRLLPKWDWPLATSAKEANAAWLAAFEDDRAASMPQLLQHLNVGGAAQAEERLMALSTAPDDPRVAMRLAELCSHHDISPERTHYWRTLLEILARVRDLRTAAPLRETFRDFTGRYYNHHRQARRIVGPFAMTEPDRALAELEPLSPKDQRDLGAVEARLGKLEAKVDRAEYEMLAGISRSWKDDAPRLVYADWLTERGHPRGELIVLACKKSLTPAEAKRRGELTLAPYIFGRLSDLGTTEDVRGAHGKTLDVDFFSNGLSWRQAIGAPLLSIVETIKVDSSGTNAADVAALMNHPDTRALLKIGPFKNAAEIEPLVKERFSRNGTSFVRR